MEAVSTAPARMPGPQHMQALAHANRVRIARAGLKRAIGSGDLQAAEVIENCPWEAESMPVGELLRSQRRWGSKRVTSFLRAQAVSETRLIGKLTERQRRVMADALRGTSAGARFEHGDRVTIAA